MIHRTLYLTGDPAQQARRTHPVVDSTGSFTIAANVRPSDTSRSMVIAQQRGANRESWTLGYEAEPSGGGRWVFQRTTSDTTASSVVEVRSRLYDNVSDELTVLVATYDRKRDVIALYVNGVRIETEGEPDTGPLFDAPFASSWPARGDLAVGNGTLNGTAAPFAGEVERVESFVGAMQPDQVFNYEGSVNTQ